MATNLSLDDALIEGSRQIGHQATKKAAVAAALEEYVQRRKRLEVLDHFGTVAIDPTYDDKANRHLDRIEVEA